MPFLTKVGSAAARAYGLLSAAVAAVPDVYFYLVSMLLPGTGTNGAQNNTFLDSSSNNFTVTRNGNTTQGTFSPFSQTGWSNYLDGAGDYLNITVSMSITGNFTWESWGYDTGVNAFGTLMGWRVGSPWTGFLVQRTNATNVQVNINQTGGIILTQTSGTYAKNAWVHVALVRSGSTITLYVNGTSVASGTLAGTITTGTAYWIGSDNLNNVTAVQYSGWISNQRFVNGTAVYTANFTPPTAPLTAITNTSLLTCQSNALVDNSANRFTITRNGDIPVTANSPFAPSVSTPTSYSGWFDGNGDYLQIANNSSLGLPTGDFTIEAWIYPTTLSGSTYTPITVYALSNAATAADLAYSIFITAANILRGVVFVGSTQYQVSSSSAITANTWTHFAIVRSGNTLTLYINGTSNATNTISGTINDGSSPVFRAAAYQENSVFYYFTGLISNLRLVKGTAVYTANFTPPTAPLTAITNTSLLTCQNATFIDNSPNAFAITVNGNAQPRTLNPFGATTTQPVAWDATTNGGSGYFDGSGDYIQYPNSTEFQFSTGNFTIEFWWYPTTLAATQPLVYHTNDSGVVGTGEFAIVYNTSLGLRFYINAGAPTIDQGSTTGWTINQWYHVAAIRNSNTLSLYRNGIMIASGSVSGVTIGANVTTQVMGESYDPLYSTGYMSNFRVVKGTAVYTSNFTPPTAPLTAITNTSLLLNYTNAGIYDAASQNALETVGNAQISTAQSKWGGGSMYFDGTGDYLIPSNILPLTLGTGDFTIEFWVYFTVGTTASRGLIDWRPASTEGVYPAILTNASSAIIFYVSSATRITGGTLSAATWTHIAVCRSGTSTRLFINGTQSGSTYTDSNNYLGPASRPMIGATGFSSGGSAFDGYMDDLRITRFARYTANFTPPAAAFSLR